MPDVTNGKRPLTPGLLMARYRPVFEDIQRDIEAAADAEHQTASAHLFDNLFIHFMTLAQRHGFVTAEQAEQALAQARASQALPDFEWWVTIWSE